MLQSVGSGVIDFVSAQYADEAARTHATVAPGVEKMMLRKSGTSEGTHMSRTLRLRNLPYGTSDRDLSYLASPYGHIIKAEMLVRVKGLAEVLFSRRKDAVNASLGLNGRQILNKPLRAYMLESEVLEDLIVGDQAYVNVDALYSLQT